MQVTGPGVILSSLAVAVGFAALRLSEFIPFVYFGTMVCIATTGSTLGNLVLLPACLTLGDRFRNRQRIQRRCRYCCYCWCLSCRCYWPWSRSCCWNCRPRSRRHRPRSRRPFAPATRPRRSAGGW